MSEVKRGSWRKKQWLGLGARAFQLYVTQQDVSTQLVQQGYDEIAGFYDTYWTEYMHHLTDVMLTRLHPARGGDALDVTCGTGYVTNQLYKTTGGTVIGVDASAGMVDIARHTHPGCRFVQQDALRYLQRQPSQQYDVVTCAWGLGYLPPRRLIQEMARVLRPGGKLGVIDNSLWSDLWSLWFLAVALSEEPAALTQLIRPHFLLTRGSLVRKMRRSGFIVRASWKGSKTFECRTKKEAINQILYSGATAGFMQMVDASCKDAVIDRVGDLLQQKYASGASIPIVHRFIAAIGEKKGGRRQH
ncbi:MAG: class I SAM-dependent methyltransferase [Candidatus Thermoplasmatota archaeon]|nr:class I SAM-dependent methyltransferase [Candidatus Thermoplasmatota archaeon]